MFAGRLEDRYSHFKAFHGCRPARMRDYYERGLLGQNKQHIVQLFRHLFADQPPADLERAIAQFERRGTDEGGRIWLLASDRPLIEDCGHYVIQGSEYLMALAAALCTGSVGGEDFRMRLRTLGVPTIVEVDIPTRLVPAEQRLEVAKMMLSEWGQCVTRRPLHSGEEPCYVIRDDIPAECIRGHYHPPRVRDPHRGFGVYVNTAVTCDACAAA